MRKGPGFSGLFFGYTGKNILNWLREGGNLPAATI